ncbi:hypothetical protein MNB_SV-6-1710 [hydrothermal vent metagenome]|uniref:DUF2059 domain-containing protein n=1 Tax=hydrothermal vent metagenome TaxID=652676 RepID=A0A1W1C5F8_9ZZZZ
MKKIVIIVGVLWINSLYGASSEKLAESILISLNMPNITQKMVDKSIEIEIKNSNAAKEYADIVERFAKEYLTWENLKKPMIESYISTFSYQDLVEIEHFFSSPVGRKFIQKSPELSKSVNMAIQKSILSYQEVLQHMIVDAELKKMQNKK